MSSEEQQDEMKPGVICWNELASNDADGSAEFYGALFGWKVETMEAVPGMPYRIMKPADGGERDGAGLLQLPPEAGDAPTRWIPYVLVEKVEDSLARAAELGAHTLVGPTELPFGRFGVIADPQGATLGFWEMKEGNC